MKMRLMIGHDLICVHKKCIGWMDGRLVGWLEMVL
jgi:hypothetical protein